MSQNSILASRLAAARKAKDYTQEDIADFLKCGRATITNYESGRRSPDFETLVKLAKKYNVTTDYLLGLTETETTDKDLRYVCDYTGLSDKAVEELRIIKELSEKGTCSDSAIVIDASKLNEENLLFFEQIKAQSRDLLYFISEFILDVKFQTIAIYIREYINCCQRFKKAEKKIITDEYLQYEDAKNYSLFKISKEIQDIVMDLCDREVDNGND